MIPGGSGYDPFAAAMQRVREEQEAAEKRNPGGRPLEDRHRGKVVTVYLRADLLEWLQEKVQLDEAKSVSQALVKAGRIAMQLEKQREKQREQWGGKRG